MPVALKRAAIAAKPGASTPIWLHLAALGAAGLFVSLLAMTYGVDLSPGLF